MGPQDVVEIQMLDAYLENIAFWVSGITVVIVILAARKLLGSFSTNVARYFMITRATNFPKISTKVFEMEGRRCELLDIKLTTVLVRDIDKKKIAPYSNEEFYKKIKWIDDTFSNGHPHKGETNGDVRKSNSKDSRRNTKVRGRKD